MRLSLRQLERNILALDRKPKMDSYSCLLSNLLASYDGSIYKINILIFTYFVKYVTIIMKSISCYGNRFPVKIMKQPTCLKVAK